MIKRSLGLFALYIGGAVIVIGWSLGQVFGGTIDTENAALVIVLPFAWVFGYWPTVMPLVIAHRIFRMQKTLEQIVERRKVGLPLDAQVDEIEDTLTVLAAEENGVPERWARPIVRRLLRGAIEVSAAR